MNQQNHLYSKRLISCSSNITCRYYCPIPWPLHVAKGRENQVSLGGAYLFTAMFGDHYPGLYDCLLESNGAHRVQLLSDQRHSHLCGKGRKLKESPSPMEILIIRNLFYIVFLLHQATRCSYSFCQI